MFKRRNHLKASITTILLISAMLTAPFSLLTNPTQVSAQVCPVFASYTGSPGHSHGSGHHPGDIPDDDNSKVSVTNTFANSEASVSIRTELTPQTGLFSQIFLNFYNIVGAYATGETEDPALADRWKTYCINRDGIASGTFQVDAKGVIHFLHHFTGPATTGDTIDDDIVDPDCDTNGDGHVTGPDPLVPGDTGESCDKRKEDDIDSPTLTGTGGKGSFTIPYPAGIRDIARKIPSIINTDMQFCTVGGPEGACSAGFTCTEIPEPQRVFYKDIGTNNGLCTIAPENVATNTLQYPVNLLCAENNDTLPTTTLASKACFNPNKSIAFTQQVHPAEDDPSFTDPAKLPFLKSGNINQVTNEIPYDIDVMERYYVPAFSNKLGLYSQEDQQIIKAMQGRIALGISTRSETIRTSGPEGNDDYVEKLGGYAEIANDSRFMNPTLIPVGAMAVTSGGHIAYLRYGDEYNGAMFVDGKPLGHKLPITQRYPYIHARGKQIAVAAVASDVVGSGENGLFVSVGFDGVNSMLPLTKIAPASPFAPPTILINSAGDKIVFAKFGDVYKYITSTNGGFGENSTPQELLGGRLDQDARFAIDDQDFIHIAWRESCGSEVCTKVNYSKVQFTNNTITTVVDLQKIPISAPLAQLKNTIPYSIQTDDQGNALVAARIGDNHNKRNQLVFMARTPSSWTSQELITEALHKDDDEVTLEFNDFSVNSAMPKISSVTVNGITRTVVVFATYLEKNDDKLNQFEQMYYAERIGPITQPTAWKSGTPVSDQTNKDWRVHLHDESISREGLIAFTVDEVTAKYDTNSKLFDPPGIKMCLIPAAGPSLDCGKNYNGSGIGYVIPPTENGDHKMHVQNSQTKQDML
jgi:hypothetical protein